MRSLVRASGRVRTSPLSPRGGLLVQAPPRARLDQLDRDRVIERFAAHGLLVFRGFEPDDAAFHALTRRFTAHFLVDRTAGRVSQAIAPEVQTVIVGNNPLNFHFEYGGMPRRPDMVWLFRDRPSEDGGQTLLSDGIALWRSLDPLARSLLQRKRLAITEPHIPEWAWREFLQIDAPLAPDRALVDALLAERLGGIEGYTYALGDDGVMRRRRVLSVTAYADFA